MTITLMAVVIVPIMSAVAMSIKSSSQGRSAAQVETALVNAADRVNRADMKCDYDDLRQGRRCSRRDGRRPQGYVTYARLPAGRHAERAGAAATDGEGVTDQNRTARGWFSE